MHPADTEPDFALQSRRAATKLKRTGKVAKAHERNFKSELTNKISLIESAPKGLYPLEPSRSD